MESNESPTPAYEKVQREHEMLHAMIGSIRQELGTRFSGAKGVADSLAKLCDCLRDHFATEEADDFYRQIELEAPRFSRKIELLCDEHTQFLAEVGSLAAKAKQGLDTDDEWDSLAKDFQHFSERLMQHEHDETDLVQKTYTEDIGTKD